MLYEFNATVPPIADGTINTNIFVCYDMQTPHMLQCLSQTEPLTKYFLSGRYKKDINKSNKLGTGGKLAKEYGH